MRKSFSRHKEGRQVNFRMPERRQKSFVSQINMEITQLFISEWEFGEEGLTGKRF